MKETILKELKKIEEAEGVKIIHCVESGSRAWGFASPDSDFDVRFIYVRRPSFYLRLEKTRDVIEWRLDDVLDINGWDLQKTLRLLHSSNPTVFEWKNSPIVYKTSAEWDAVKGLIDSYFNPKAGIYHYLSMAKTNYRGYLKSDEVKLKKYFYVLRPIYACLWILKYGTPPPMEFIKLHREFTPPALEKSVERLIDIKMNTPEINTGKRIEEINEYIEKALGETEAALSAVQASKGDWQRLDEAFTNVLNSAYKGE